MSNLIDFHISVTEEVPGQRYVVQVKSFIGTQARTMQTTVNSFQSCAVWAMGEIASAANELSWIKMLSDAERMPSVSGLADDLATREIEADKKRERAEAAAAKTAGGAA